MFFRRLLPLCAIGLVVSVGAIVSRGAAPNVIGIAQLAASDWLTVKAGGLRLGARPVRDDIALILFDYASAAQLGYVRTHDDDIQLYRKLFASGAKVVYDTRTIAAADEANFEELKPFFEAMRELRSDGTLLRDAYLGADLLAETHPRYTNLLAPNLVNAHPHALPRVRSRLYPMFHLTSVGLMESAPLLVARRVWGEANADLEAIADGMNASGMMAVWQEQAPQVVGEAEQSPPAPYAIGSRSITWHPFLSTSILVPPAAFWVDYGPAVDGYRRYSYVEVLQQSDHLPFAEQIVIIGTSSETEVSSDGYEVPSIERKAAPAELVAAAVQTLLDDRNMRAPSVAIQAAVLVLLCLGLALLGGWLRPVQSVFVSVGVLTVYIAGAVLAYRSDWYADFAVTPIAAMLSSFLGIVYNSWLNVRARQRVVDLFGRYVPRAVVNELMVQPDLKSLMLGGAKQDVSVMFADIRGFTTFSEDLPPEEVVRQLNSLLEIMVECTFENEGTLDKFIGDAILVLFNAPLKQSDHVARAVRTAIAIQQRLAKHPTGLAVGIGLHRGEAVVGNIGTPRRMEYTAIGSTVNIASRLCGIAEPGQIILSVAMVDELDSEIPMESLPPVSVKGIKAPLSAYRIAVDGR